MRPFVVSSVGVYRHPQRLEELRRYEAVGLVVAGFTTWSQAGMDRLDQLPCLHVAPRGAHAVFEADARRENWVVIVRGIGFRPGPDPDTAEFDDVDGTVRLPLVLPLAPERVPGWRREFERMHAAFRDPTPANRLRVRAGVVRVIAELLDAATAPPPEEPEARLKRLIDDDPACTEDLAVLARRCGRSGDHLRLRFGAAYGMSPQAYRHQRRLAAAMDLVHDTDLAVKQIARRLGFRHTAGFSGWFRRHAGRTATEAIREWRGT